jgi:Arylsulfotransferase (ASST)/Secretion system C-terminal sorting domain
MRRPAYPSLIASILFLTILIDPSFGQDNTVGVINKTSSVYDAYTLFSPSGNKLVYLIDNDGRIVNQWESEFLPGNAVYLQEDGSLYRAGRAPSGFIQAGGGGGMLEKYNWEGDLLWTYINADEDSRGHHDFYVLPNGNILYLVWEEYSNEVVLANGRNPELLTEDVLWPEAILELEPTGSQGANVVWEWHSWDHIIQDFDATKLNFGVVADNPGKIDLNYTEVGKTGADWHHANSLSYNPELDQIILSVLFFDEIWVIDHNSTTEEARGDKGDLIFRWGNPRTYGAGTIDDQLLFGQHNAHWIQSGLPDEGKMMIFNNGPGRPAGNFSSIVKISPTIMGDGSYEMASDNSFLPTTYDYEYTARVPTDFYSWYISGVQQLPTGGLLIDDGAHGTFFEINAAGVELWRYVNPVTPLAILKQGEMPISASNGNPNNGVFRALKYGKDFSAFVGKDLTPGDFIETYPILGIDDPHLLTTPIFPNPAEDIVNINSTSFNNRVQLLNMSGQIVYDESFTTDKIQLKVGHLAKGIYQALLNNQSIGRIILN